MTNRPKLNIPFQPIDKLLLISNTIVLIAFFATCTYYYSILPDEIPTHYNFAGKPDAYGDKESIFSLPAIALIIAIPMLIISRKPHLFNYPVKITPENAQAQYTKATRLINILALMTTLVMFFIEIQTIRTVLGKADGLGESFVYIFFILMFIPTIFYLISMKKSSKKV